MAAIFAIALASGRGHHALARLLQLRSQLLALLALMRCEGVEAVDQLLESLGKARQIDLDRNLDRAAALPLKIRSTGSASFARSASLARLDRDGPWAVVPSGRPRPCLSKVTRTTRPSLRAGS